jgi:hypothetical protein
MALSVKGTYRVQSVYMAEKAAYVTLKDKGDQSVLKVSFALPLPKAIVDDALVGLDGGISSRLFGNNVSLSYQGNVTAVSEK